MRQSEIEVFLLIPQLKLSQICNLIENSEEITIIQAKIQKKFTNSIETQSLRAKD